MLNIRFCEDAVRVDDEILFEEPYSRLSAFFGDEVQASYSHADRLAKELRGIVGGTEEPWVNGIGTAWTLDVDAKVARLTCYFGNPPAKIELPTVWLIDALERWRDHLLAMKRKRGA